MIIIKDIKGKNEVAKATKTIVNRDKNTWLDLYYNIEKKAVYIEPGEGRYKLTTLINPQTEQDIEETVNYFMNL